MQLCATSSSMRRASAGDVGGLPFQALRLARISRDSGALTITHHTDYAYLYDRSRMVHVVWYLLFTPWFGVAIFHGVAGYYHGSTTFDGAMRRILGSARRSGSFAPMTGANDGVQVPPFIEY